MLRVYDPNIVIVTFATLRIQGFAEGTFLNIERVSDLYTWKVGADGEVARSKSLDRRRLARLTLMQSSDSNDTLSGIVHLGERAPNGADVAPFTVKDLSGRTVFEDPLAFIMRDPNVEFGVEVGPREWVFALPDPQWFTGGNA